MLDLFKRLWVQLGELPCQSVAMTRLVVSAVRGCASGSGSLERLPAPTTEYASFERSLTRATTNVAIPDHEMFDRV